MPIKDDIAERRARLAARRTALPSAKQAELERLLGNSSTEIVQGELIPRRAQDSPGKLSSAQLRLWFLNQMVPDSAVYNIAAAFSLEGTLNLEALRQSLNEVIRRHESLRTGFVAVDGHPSPVVVSNRNLDVQLVDLCDLSAGLRETRARQLALEVAQAPFDLAQDQLLRVTIFKLAADNHLLALSMHHIISDAWSSQILIREVGAFYNAIVSGTPSLLIELPIQYGDYAAWQVKRLESDALQSLLSYWKKQLEGAPLLLELPSDRPRPAVMTFKGAWLEVEVSEHLTQALRTRSQQAGLTLFTTLAASFQLLLSRYSGQQDISIGVPVAGRPTAETEALIGLFVNTIVLRTRLSGNHSIRELLHQVKEVVFDAQAHQDLPFEKLVEELRPDRSLSYSPLVQCMFALQNVPRTSLELSGLRLIEVPIDTGVEKFDLTLSLSEEKGGLRGVLSYSTDLFDQVSMRSLLQRWRRVLDTIAAEPDSLVASVSLLTDTERAQVLMDWNYTATEYPSQFVHELFEECARTTPSVLALESGQAWWEQSYGELNRLANQIGHYLAKRGIGPDMRVGICMDRELYLVPVLLGILKAGAAYVPLDPGYPLERLHYMVEDAQISLLITQKPHLRQFESCGIPVICLADHRHLIKKESIENLGIPLHEDNLAYVIYTSGSTGKPKGAMNTHGGLRNRLQWMQQTYHLNGEDRVLQKTPFSFDVSVWEFFWPLIAGARLVLADPGGHQDPEYLGEVIRSRQITTIHFVPSMLRAFLQSGGVRKCGNLRRIICSGEALGPELAKECLELIPAELHNLYGPTEAAIDVTFWRCRIEDLAGGVAIGKPIANIQIYVLDKEYEPVPVGMAGEIYIGGVGLARGYWNRPELTAERFIPNPWGGPGSRLYRTGDKGRWRRDGNIEYLGRLDDQVKVRGFRIELQEIELALNHHADVSQAAVTIMDPGTADAALVAYVVGRVQNGRLATKEIREYLKSTLPEYMVPGVYVQLDSLPLTPSGKIDRKMLPKPQLDSDDSQSATSLEAEEEILTGIFAGVLGRKHVGSKENFFELGGHSLLATQVISRIRNIFSIELPVQTLFAAPTAAELSQRIRDAAGDRRLVKQRIRKGHRLDSLPLSFAQRRLWFIDHLKPGDSTYNLPFAVRLVGRLDRRALTWSLNEIAKRHEVLRTVFPITDGKPTQQIIDDLELIIQEKDLGALKSEDWEQQASQWARVEAAQPFDLAHGPLLRLKVLHRGEEEHILFICMHHIVSDAWSMGILVREFSSLYKAFIQGESSPLPDLDIQYADFAVWQNSWMQGDVIAEQLAYWRRQLAQVPALELPTDQPRPPAMSHRGSSVSFRLPANLTHSLQDLSRREGVTLFMTLLASFQIILSKYSGQTDIAVGTAVANRNSLEIEQLVGFFVNTLVLRTDLSGNPDFRAVLGRVRQVALDAYRCQDVPFEKLVEELQPERNRSRTPLFQVMLVLQNTRPEELQLPGLHLSEFPVNLDVSKFDMLLSLNEVAGELAGELSYATDLYEKTTIESLLTHFMSLLESAAADPEQHIDEILLLSKAEREQLLLRSKQNQVEYPRLTLDQLFELQAAKTPQSVALECEDRALTYDQLNQRANRLANHLSGLGIGPEVTAAICIERSIDMVVAMLAVLKAGGAYVPLDPTYPTERLHFMLEDSHAAVLLTQKHVAERFLHCAAHLVVLEDKQDEIAQCSPAAPLVKSDPQNLAYLIYTSGSTGKPKGVAITHGSAVILIHWAREIFSAADLGGVLASTSICFDLSVFEIFVPLSWGGKVIMARHALDLQRLSGSGRIKLINTVPSAVAELVRIRAIPSSVSTINLAGERLHRNLVNQIFDSKHIRHIFNLYGPTETTTYSSYARLQESEQSGIVPIGEPIPNTRLYVLDTVQQLVPAGITGELYIGGAGLARGYLNRPELTAERFVPDPFSEVSGSRMYRTGDHVRLRRDGNMEFLGRLDQQVKLRGYRIELGEIESLLKQHLQVQEAAIVAHEFTPGDRRLVAYVVYQDGASPDNQELKSYLEQKLPEYMVPFLFVTLDTMPLTLNGKIDRNALPAPDPSALNVGRIFVPPRDELQTRLVAIWEELLPIRPIGIQDDFFQLGGHSLLAVQLITRIEERTGRRIPVAALFEGATIERLAQLLSQESETPSWSPLVPIQPKGSNPPLFVAHSAYGQVITYGDLAKALGTDQPMYGLQSRETNKDLTPHNQVEAMAAEYVAAIRAFRPSGPYLIGGWSMGGLIAFEMARQLRRQNQKVALLAIIDISAPAGGKTDERLFNRTVLLAKFVHDLHMPLEGLGASWDEISRLPVMAQIQRVWTEARKSNSIPSGMTLSEFRQVFDAFKTSLHLAQSYAGGTFDGDLTLFTAVQSVRPIRKNVKEDWDANPDPTRGWASLVRNLEIYPLPGDHYSIMREPNVQFLAEQLRASIRKSLEGESLEFVAVAV